MDYEGICEDLLEMERKAQFRAVRAMNLETTNEIFEYLKFAHGCQAFRYVLFLRGFGSGGY